MGLPNDTKPTFLVTGAMGLIGRALFDECEGRTDIELIGVSRRHPDHVTGRQFRSIDLLDATACQQGMTDLLAVTCLVYAAWTPAATREDEVAPNVRMFRNTLETLERSAPNLRHVILLQGTKAYGTHLGPFPDPARETAPRSMPPNFYYDQEDFMLRAQRGKSWTWTILRPVTVYGFALASPINVGTGIGVYAAISKELGVPLRFPAAVGPYRNLRQAVDARLVAKAILWATEEPKCSNETFNISNGDHFRFSNLWQDVARVFDIDIGEPLALDLAQLMPPKAKVWQEMVRKYHLAAHPYTELVDWGAVGNGLARPHEGLVDTLKCRKFGFDAFEDTSAMVERQLRGMMESRIIPGRVP